MATTPNPLTLAGTVLEVGTFRGRPTVTLQFEDKQELRIPVSKEVAQAWAKRLYEPFELSVRAHEGTASPAREADEGSADR